MLRIRTRKNGLTSSVVLPTNPEESTVIYIRALQGQSHGVTINSDLFCTVDLERKHIPQGQLYKSIRFTGRRSESKKDKTGLFLVSSESARTVIGIVEDFFINQDRRPE